jgi:hypothetical protein
LPVLKFRTGALLALDIGVQVALGEEVLLEQLLHVAEPDFGVEVGLGGYFGQLGEPAAGAAGAVFQQLVGFAIAALALDGGGQLLGALLVLLAGQAVRGFQLVELLLDLVQLELGIDEGRGLKGDFGLEEGGPAAVDEFGRQLLRLVEPAAPLVRKNNSKLTVERM